MSEQVSKHALDQAQEPDRDQAPLAGLNCPNCGGVVQVPEGQVIVRCPYCDLRSFVRGERGVRRYQVACRMNREQALSAMDKFLSGSWAIALNARHEARLSEAFLAYLPFWSLWGRVAGWAFGQKRVRSGDKTRYEPREVKILEEMNWNGAACDVGEFGVDGIQLSNQPLEPFNPDSLHAAGLVFEPVGSPLEAQKLAENSFSGRVKSKAQLSRLSQLFVRSLRKRFGLVYYPLWVLRYLYRGRVFQVVVDGFSGQVLYGKAPGNTLYRAAMLVGGMALGAFLAVDISALLIYLGGEDVDEILGAGLIAVVIGFGMMAFAYRAFRYGEQYEHRAKGTHSKTGIKDLTGKVGDVEQWLERLN